MKLNIFKNKTRDKKDTLPHAGTLAFHFYGRKAGQPLRYGHLEMIPLFGQAGPEGLYATPETNLTLTKVTTYGQMMLLNVSAKHAIVPLHLGYFQQGAQNHAMCTSWILNPNEEKLFKDACCIQQSQGGYIKNQNARFIILPHQLRTKATELKGQENYGKLWKAIAAFNEKVGLKNRGHLDELKQVYQPELLQTVYHLEPQPGQTGAIFLNRGKVVGIELAPDADFWKELHVPLVMYCYAPLRLEADLANAPIGKGMELDRTGITSIDELKLAYRELKAKRLEAAEQLIAQISGTVIHTSNEYSTGKHRLQNLTGGKWKGQGVTYKGQPVYLSMFNREDFYIN